MTARKYIREKQLFQAERVFRGEEGLVTGSRQQKTITSIKHFFAASWPDSEFLYSLSSFPDLISFATGRHGHELYSDFLKKLYDLLNDRSEKLNTLLTQLAMLEEFQESEESPLLSQLFFSRFRLETASIIRNLEYELERFFGSNSINRQGFEQFLQRYVLADAKDLLNLIAIVSLTDLTVVLAIPVKHSQNTHAMDVQSLVIPPTMTLHTDLSPWALVDTMQNVNGPVLLLFSVNDGWLAVKPNHPDWGALPRLFGQITRTASLHASIIFHETRPLQEHRPLEGKLAFFHKMAHSRAVILSEPPVTDDQYFLYLFANAWHLYRISNAEQVIPERLPLLPVLALSQQGAQQQEPAEVYEGTGTEGEYTLSGKSSTQTKEQSIISQLEILEAELEQSPNRWELRLNNLRKQYHDLLHSGTFIGSADVQRIDQLFLKLDHYSVRAFKTLDVRTWRDLLAGLERAEALMGMYKSTGQGLLTTPIQELMELDDRLSALSQVTDMQSHRQEYFRYFQILQALVPVRPFFSMRLPKQLLKMSDRAWRQLIAGQCQSGRLALEGHNRKAITSHESMPLTSLDRSNQQVSGETVILLKLHQMGHFLQNLELSGDANISDQEMLDMAEDLGMTPLLQFVCNPDNAQKLDSYTSDPADTVMLPTGAEATGMLFLAGNPHTPESLPGPEGRALAIHPSRAMRLFTTRYLPAELLTGSRELRRATIARALAAAQARAGDTLFHCPVDRYMADYIHVGPDFAGLKSGTNRLSLNFACQPEALTDKELEQATEEVSNRSVCFPEF